MTTVVCIVFILQHSGISLFFSAVMPEKKAGVLPRDPRGETPAFFSRRQLPSEVLVGKAL